MAPSSAAEAVKENKQHYAAAQAVASAEPASPMAGFLRSFVAGGGFNPGSEED